jgi:osmotically-inducible protein OsmY
MNRSGMLEQLAHAVRRVHEVQELINRQRGRIRDLRRRGHDTQNAESVLAQLEQSQMLYASDTERLEANLEELE